MKTAKLSKFVTDNFTFESFLSTFRAENTSKIRIFMAKIDE